MTPVKYEATARLPSSLATTPKVAIFVAGPANINTNTAPGETPDNNKPAAMGVDAVAQTYIGIEIKITTIMAKMPLPHWLKKLIGT